MALNSKQIAELYHRRARGYDFAVTLYRLAGLRVSHYRRLAVDSLQLKQGDSVVEIGCGTGLNFHLLRDAVGASGNVIGVDITAQMLDQAQARISRMGWHNVELVHVDAKDYVFSVGVNGILSTLAISLIPAFDDIIRRGGRALVSGGRISILDMKQPKKWPPWLVRFAIWATSPYGVSLDLADRHPWESVRRHLKEVEYRELYFGALFLSVGESAG